MRGVQSLLCALVHMKGSVLPKAIACAMPSAFLAWVCVHYRNTGLFEEVFGRTILSNNAAYTGFMTAMSFLFVFRTSQAYSRFWEGMTLGQNIFAQLLNFSSCAIAFTRFSEASVQQTMNFQHRLVRLISLLHAQTASQLRGIDGSRYEILDLAAFVKEDLEEVWSNEQPVVVVTQWILELIVEGMEKKIMAAPPPVCSRVFQEFSNGIVCYHDAKKLDKISFPFPYTQLSGVCLIAHCMIFPLIMSEWVLWKSTAFILTLLQVTVMWTLYLVATDIEHPFHPGDVQAEYGTTELQRELNGALAALVSKKMRNIPRMVEGSSFSASKLLRRAKSFTIDSKVPGVSRVPAEKGRADTRHHRLYRCCARGRYFAQTWRRHSRAEVLATASKFQDVVSDDSEESESLASSVVKEQDVADLQDVLVPCERDPAAKPREFEIIKV
mmetsp:Transcript_24608/g.56792  ORF Transcript_24608/g.56792 Transcript_24608/m.56792 type:complete len:440 (+) Transcript_24608:76-1395(+)